MKRTAVAVSMAVLVSTLCAAPRDPRLKNAFRRAPSHGWTFVHLQGTPREIGYQHGALLRREIEDACAAVRTDLQHDTKHDWSYFRTAAERDFWPHVEAEYREELQGIAEGLKARGSKLDVWDVVALNASLEFSPYYTGWRDHASRNAAGEHCSAFVATGSYTRDGRVVIGHNNWIGYMEGARCVAIYDIVPAHGHRILMDGMPGLIDSGDDFGINSAGILITETTISRFHGFDPNGIPEFVRARKAMQYADSIDDFARIMRDGNNGGYADNWLVADRKTNEIADLELGLKHVHLWRKKDGYFVGANFPVDPELARDETHFDLTDMSIGANARHVRAVQLMEQWKGSIDIAAAKQYLSDHYDSFERKVAPSERTLCGHIDLSPRGNPTWQPPYGTAGTVQAKVTDAAMAERMSFVAAAGHPCGINFIAAEYLSKHPEFDWERGELRDLISRPWTVFTAR